MYLIGISLKANKSTRSWFILFYDQEIKMCDSLKINYMVLYIVPQN